VSDKQLTQTDIERFELMAKNGSEAMDIFAQAIKEGYKKYDGIVLLRRIFDFDLMQCTELVQQFDKQSQ
jgi:hypothetical protein